MSESIGSLSNMEGSTAESPTMAGSQLAGVEGCSLESLLYSTPSKTLDTLKLRARKISRGIRSEESTVQRRAISLAATSRYKQS